MSELKQYIRKHLDSRGSTLVAAVAFSIILAIGAIGLIQSTVISQNSETAALRNDKAFQAAESGVWLAARWLRGNATLAEPTSFDPFGGTLSLNGYTIKVTVKQVAAGATNLWHISDTVYDGPTRVKSVTWDRVRLSGFGNYTTYMGEYCNRNLNPANNDIWGYGMSGQKFYGKTWFNKLWIGLSMLDEINRNRPNDPEIIQFNGPVYTSRFSDSLLDENYKYHVLKQNSFNNGHFGNDYNSGIHFNIKASQAKYNAIWNPTDTTSHRWLDTIFKDKYYGEQDLIDQATGGLDLNAATKIDLSTIPNRDLSRTPTLVFNTATAKYYYYKNPSGWGSSTYDSVTYNATSATVWDPSTQKTIFYDNTNLQVKGTVAGKTTIATENGTDIIPVGDIVTPGYNPTTETPSGSDAYNSLIGLAPGKDLRIVPSYKMKGSTSLSVTPANDSNLEIAASVMTMYTDGIANGHRGTINTMDNTLYSNGSPQVGKCPFGLTIYGNRITAGWSSIRDNSDANGRSIGIRVLTTKEDVRLKNTLPPGYKIPKSQDGLFMISMTGWKEKSY